jgi:hypothetical protein
MSLTCFRAKHHTVDFMAIDVFSDYLATGCGMDVQIWKGGRRRMHSHDSLWAFINL